MHIRIVPGAPHPSLNALFGGYRPFFLVRYHHAHHNHLRRMRCSTTPPRRFYLKVPEAWEVQLFVLFCCNLRFPRRGLATSGCATSSSRPLWSKRRPGISYHGMPLADFDRLLVECATRNLTVAAPSSHGTIWYVLGGVGMLSRHPSNCWPP